jgi:hypothetical protein
MTRRERLGGLLRTVQNHMIRIAEGESQFGDIRPVRPTC